MSYNERINYVYHINITGAPANASFRIDYCSFQEGYPNWEAYNLLLPSRGFKTTNDAKMSVVGTLPVLMENAAITGL